MLNTAYSQARVQRIAALAHREKIRRLLSTLAWYLAIIYLLGFLKQEQWM